MEYNPNGGVVERMRAELVKTGALPPDAASPPAPGVAAPAPVVPVGVQPAPGAPGAVPPQPGAVDAAGHPILPTPEARPTTGDMVQGETGPNGEPLIYVVHDNIVSKLTIAELSQDHSYKAHNTRTAQENADKRRELDLLETRLLAEKATLLNVGGATFDNLLADGAPGPVAPPAVVPPVPIPPAPPVELAVENPDEYARLVAARDVATVAHNDSVIAASVASAVKPLADQAAATAKQAEATVEQQAATQRQADLKVRQDQQMINLQARIPELDMNLVADFMARSSHEDAARFNTPEGYEFIWGKITRGEQPGGVVALAPVVPGYAPPPPAYPAPAPAVPPPPYAEPGAGGGRVAHTPPGTAGAPMPNMTNAHEIAQAIQAKRVTTGPQVYVPHAVAR